jgi:hypothetical protein
LADGCAYSEDRGHIHLKDAKRMNESLELKIAAEAIAEYHDELLAEHADAMERFDCQTHLQHGIDAFRWLASAEHTIREAIYRGLLENSPQLQELIESLYRRWLDPCVTAEQWIERQVEKQYTLDNLAEFRDCCEKVRAWIEENEWKKIARKANQVHFANEAW